MTVDYRNIVKNNESFMEKKKKNMKEIKSRENDEDFVDNSDVPPLM